MSESSVTSHSVTIRPNLVHIVLDLMRLHTLYLDVHGSAYEVLGVSTTTDDVIIRRTPTPTRYINWDIKLLSNDRKHLQEYDIYCVKTTAALTGELTTVKVS